MSSGKLVKADDDDDTTARPVFGRPERCRNGQLNIHLRPRVFRTCGLFAMGHYFHQRDLDNSVGRYARVIIWLRDSARFGKIPT